METANGDPTSSLLLVEFMMLTMVEYVKVHTTEMGLAFLERKTQFGREMKEHLQLILDGALCL